MDAPPKPDGLNMNISDMFHDDFRKNTDVADAKHILPNMGDLAYDLHTALNETFGGTEANRDISHALTRFFKAHTHDCNMPVVHNVTDALAFMCGRVVRICSKTGYLQGGCYIPLRAALPYVKYFYASCKIDDLEVGSFIERIIGELDTDNKVLYVAIPDCMYPIQDHLDKLDIIRALFDAVGFEPILRSLCNKHHLQFAVTSSRLQGCHFEPSIETLDTLRSHLTEQDLKQLPDIAAQAVFHSKHQIDLALPYTQTGRIPHNLSHSSLNAARTLLEVMTGYVIKEVQDSDRKAFYVASKLSLTPLQIYNVNFVVTKGMEPWLNALKTVLNCNSFVNVHKFTLDVDPVEAKQAMLRISCLVHCTLKGLSIKWFVDGNTFTLLAAGHSNLGVQLMPLHKRPELPDPMHAGVHKLQAAHTKAVNYALSVAFQCNQERIVYDALRYNVVYRDGILLKTFPTWLSEQHLAEHIEQRIAAGDRCGQFKFQRTESMSNFRQQSIAKCMALTYQRTITIDMTNNEPNNAVYMWVYHA